MGGGDFRVRSGSTNIPIQTDFEDTTAAPEEKGLPRTQGEPQQQSPKPADKNSASSKLAEFNLSGQLQAINLRNQSAQSGTLFSTPANPPKTGGVTLPSRSTVPAKEVKDFQVSMNKVRAELGQSPVKENGLMDADMETATKELQKSLGLPQDGKATPETQGRLAKVETILQNKTNDPNLGKKLKDLAGSSGFLKLGEPAQSKVLDRFLENSKDPGKTMNNGLMTALITHNGYDQLSNHHQKALLHILSLHPDSPSVAGNLTQLAESPNFRNLDPGTQEKLLHVYMNHGNNFKQLDNLQIMITDTKDFDKLSKTSRDKLIRIHMENPDDTGLHDNLRNATGRQDFKNMPQDMQTEVINQVLEYPRDTQVPVNNLMDLLTRPKFQDPDVVHPDVHDQILKNLPYLYQTGLDATKRDNLMKLASAPGLERINPRVREAMLGALANHPDNAQLADDLAQLATSHKFLRDPRLQLGIIQDLNDKAQ